MTTDDQFHAWAARAKRGDALPYYRGHLGAHREEGNRHARAVGSAAGVAHECGMVSLVQRREGGELVYVAVRL